MAHILLVEDEAEIIDLISIYLQNERHSVQSFQTPGDALAANLSAVEAAVLDVMMPGMDGMQLCRALRQKGHPFPIIMLTARDADTDKITGLALGADDYMVKPFNPLELMARINAQLRRVRMLECALNEPVSFIEINGLALNADAHTCTLYGRPLDLTPTEFSILLLLAQNRGRVIGSEQIFETVWGEKYLESNNTVMVHVQKLRKKLGDTGKRKTIIQTIWGVGYKIENG